MAGEPQSLKATHVQAEQKRNAIEISFESNSSTFQENLLSAIQLYEQCLSIADRISLFSPNETLEDIATADLQYLLLDYRIAELILRINNGIKGRRTNLERAQKSYAKYLKLLDNYDMLSKSDTVLLEQYHDALNTFSTALSNDPATRRDAKIKRFKEEKALKEKLAYMQRNPSVLQNDDRAGRELWLTQINYYTHQTFASLESIAQELHILSMAPPSPPPNVVQRTTDDRDRNDRIRPFADNDRLDAPLNLLSAGLRGPLLDKSGKPLRPFTLTSKRQEFRDGVFRPDHSLPTMSIDEYLEEERKRGGMIEGGGEASGRKPEVDEDDYEAADRETMKAREWDEYVEANPRGSGNTLNRG